MKRKRITAGGRSAVCVAALALAGCASQVGVTRLTGNLLSDAFASRAAEAWVIADDVRVQILRPRLALVSGTDRLRADFDVLVEALGRAAPWPARWAIDARLQWQHATCTLTWHQVQVDLAPPERAGEVVLRRDELRLAAALSRRLEGTVIWSSGERGTPCAPGQVRLTADAVELRSGG